MKRSLLQGPVLFALAGCGSPSASPAAPPFTLKEVAGFSTPWAMDFLPGRGPWALLTEREGKLWLVDVDNGQRLPVEGVPQVHVAGQGGLGDVVAAPDFATSKRVYLSWVEAGPDGTSGAVLGHATLENRAGRERLENMKVIWRQDPKVVSDVHFSHRIAVAPDGTLFVSSGERFQFTPAQDPNSDLGKIIHMTSEGQRIGGRFYTLGHRNVLGLAFAPDGRLWESEMGPMGGDEINLILPGRNYGWPRASNGSNYDGSDIPDHKAGDGFEAPKVWWNPSISPGGLLIYTGDRFKGWKGDALVPALSGEALIRVHLSGDKAAKADQWDMGKRIRAVDQGPDGRVFILEDGGRLMELTPRP